MRCRRAGGYLFVVNPHTLTRTADHASVTTILRLAPAKNESMYPSTFKNSPDLIASCPVLVLARRGGGGGSDAYKCR